MLEYLSHTCSRISMSSCPIHLEQEHRRDLHPHVDFLRRWLFAECTHRLCHLDTPAASCMESEDGHGTEDLRSWYVHAGLTVS